MTTTNPTAVRTAARVDRFSYAIRAIVADAQKVEAAGRRVRYLNIGDPVAFGFRTPPHLISAVEQAMRDGHNTYGPSVGIEAAREAVAAEYSRRGFPVSVDRVLITAGTSEGIELTLSAVADVGSEVLVPMPTYPLYTAVLAKVDASAKYYRLDPSNQWMPDFDDLERLVTDATRVLVVIDPNNPTGSVYPPEVRRRLLDFAERHGLLILADEVYGDLGFEGSVEPIGALDPDAPIISFSSLSKAYLAPGWRTGWMAAGRSPRLDDIVAAVKKLADGRLCTALPMQYAIAPALNGDRSHQASFRLALKARADLTVARLAAMPGIHCVAPSAAFYVMPRVAVPRGQTDLDFVKALLESTGILCVHGSGFGMPADQGFFRVIYLAPPEDLHEIFDSMADFTARYLQA